MLKLLPIALFTLLICADSRAATLSSVRIGTSASTYPYSFGKADGCQSSSGVCGFEVDLFSAICAEMKLDCHWVIHDWDGIFDNLTNPQSTGEYAYDAVIDSLEASPARRLQMLFTMSYFTAWDIFVGKTSLRPQLDSDGYPLDIASQPFKIGTWSGFLMDELTARYGAHPKYVQLVNVDDPIAAIQAGQVDLIFVYTGIETKLVQQDPTYAIVPGALIQNKAPDPLGGDSVATRISPQGQWIREMFNEGLIAVRKNGTYQRISQKWLGRDIWDCILGPQIQDPHCTGSDSRAAGIGHQFQ